MGKSARIRSTSSAVFAGAGLNTHKIIPFQSEFTTVTIMARMGPLGILGGGQLGRMTLQAASRLGIDVVIAERFADSPAARLTSQSVVFEHGWDDPNALQQL